MKPFCTILALAAVAGACYGIPLDVGHREYVYPSSLPNDHGDDLAHHFQYKEYFPTPPIIESDYLGGKIYASKHSFSVPTGDKFHYGVGDYLGNAAHTIGHAHAQISGHVGDKLSYVQKGISDHFGSHFYGHGYNGGHLDYKGYADHENHGGIIGSISSGIQHHFSDHVQNIKHAHQGLSDTISHGAQAVKSGIGETVSKAAHVISEAQADISHHISKSASEIKDGISGHLSESAYTAKSLFGILGEFLSRNVQNIKHGVGEHFAAKGHAIQAAQSAIFNHLGKKAHGVSDYFSGKAHDIQVKLNKNFHREGDFPKAVGPLEGKLYTIGFDDYQKSGHYAPGYGAVAHGVESGAIVSHVPTHLFAPVPATVH